MKRILFLLFVEVCFLFSGTVFSKEKKQPKEKIPAPEFLLKNAEKKIAQKKFSLAMSDLRVFGKKYWGKKQSIKAIPLLVDGYLREGKSDSVLFWANRYCKYHPESPYIDRVWISQAGAFALQHQYFESARTLIRVLHFTTNQYMYHRARLNFLDILDKNLLSSFEILALLQEHPVDNRIVGTMLFTLGMDSEKKGKARSARSYFNRLASEIPEHSLVEKAKEELVKLESAPAGSPSVLIVAPLSGNLSEIGRASIQGAILALEKFADPKHPLDYTIVDSKRDPALTVQKVRERFLEDSVVAVIGPVMSSTAVTLAAWLSQAYPNVPMITPTATDEGIAELGANIFQINIPVNRLARSIAKYSLECLHVKEYSILAPNTDYGHLMADEFSRVVEERGGLVNTMEYFQEGEEDYEKHFQAIRLHAYNRMLEQKNLNWGGTGKVRINLKERQKFFEEEDTKIPALFIVAADPTEAAKLATQTDFYKIKTQILGSSGWYGSKVLRKGRKYVENAVFTVPFLEKSSDSVWISFRQAYSKRWSTYPSSDRVAGMSYDATRLFLTAWNQSEESNIVRSIQKVPALNGTYGRMIFDAASGANTTVHRIQIRDHKFHLLQGCGEVQSKDK